jgi:hypothetical protein
MVMNLISAPLHQLVAAVLADGFDLTSISGSSACGFTATFAQHPRIFRARGGTEAEAVRAAAELVLSVTGVSIHIRAVEIIGND